MALSYEFSIGSVRARENKLLSPSDFQYLQSAKTEKEYLQYLSEKSFGEGQTLEQLLRHNADETWNYIKSIAPDIQMFSIFFLENDLYHFKTILKAVIFNKNCDRLLKTRCNIKVTDLKNILENRNFGSLPEWLAEPAQEAYTLLAHTKDARLSDSVLDKIFMEQMISESKKSKSEFLYRYFSEKVFYANLKIALRASRMKAERDFLEKALCDSCPGFDKEEVIKKTLSGTEILYKYLEKISDYGCQQAVKTFRNSSREFEKYLSERLLKLTKEYCQYTAEGPEPLYGYYITTESQRQKIKLIKAGYYS